MKNELARRLTGISLFSAEINVFSHMTAPARLARLIIINFQPLQWCTFCLSIFRRSIVPLYFYISVRLQANSVRLDVESLSTFKIVNIIGRSLLIINERAKINRIEFVKQSNENFIIGKYRTQMKFTRISYNLNCRKACHYTNVFVRSSVGTQEDNIKGR